MNFSEIEKNLKLNQHIQKDIRQIVFECYYDIYNYLGRTGFIKWVDKQNLTIGIRNIIFKALTEKEDEYLKNNRWVAGYHVQPLNPNQKENIVLRKGVGDNKDTNAHEIFHSIVDGLGGFNRFWGEGITEFCKKAMYNRTEYSYPKNVEMVFLAYSMFGNIILKDYFSKQGDKFYFHLAKGAENHLFQIMMKIGKELDGNLENYHSIMYNQKRATAKELKTADQDLKDGISGLLSFYYMYKQEQIKRFKHIREDRIDFNGFIDEQVEILRYLKILDTNRKEYKGIYEQYGFIRKNLIEKMLQNSHFIFNKSEEEKRQIVDKITRDIDSKIASRSSGRYLSIEETYINQEVEEPYRTLNENATGKLVVTFLYKDECKDFLTTMRKIADIQAATTEFSNEEVVDTLKIIGGNLKDKNALAILGNARTFARAIENISQLEQQYEYDLEMPTFKKIHIEGLENLNTFVEFNEDKQFLVVIDTEEGRVDRVSLNDYSSESSEFKLFTYKNSENDNSDENSYEIVMSNKKVSEIVLDSKTQKVEVTNGKVDPRLIVGMQSIYEDTLNSVTFKVIEKDIALGSYSHGMSKDQKVLSTVRISDNKRSIDIDDFIQDYIETKKLIPGIDKQETVFVDMSEKLIDTTFEAHMIPEGTVNQQLYNRQKYALVTDMKQLLQERQRGNNERNVEVLHKRLNDDLENLNSTVDKATSKENIGILVGREEAGNEFLRSAVDGTKTRARTSGMQSQIELIRQRELLKRGLTMKNTEEKGQEYGDN